MKARSFQYLTFEGLKNVWVNRLMSVASVGVLTACMLLMGIAIAFSFNVDVIMGTVEDQNVVMVYLEDGLSDGDRQEVEDALRAIDNVKNLEYVSKEVALDSITQGFRDDQKLLFEEFKGEENPLPDALKVTYKDLSLFDETTGQIEQMKQNMKISEVSNKRDVANQVNSLRNVINIASIWLIALLMVIALVIISNTIRITMFSRKLEISIMKAVGATDGFIRFPFMIEGIILGIIAAGVAFGLVYLIYRLAADAVTGNLMLNLNLLPFGSFAAIIFGIFLVLGAIAGMLGSLVSIRKYLKREGSEFSEI